MLHSCYLGQVEVGQFQHGICSNKYSFPSISSHKRVLNFQIQLSNNGRQIGFLESKKKSIYKQMKNIKLNTLYMCMFITIMNFSSYTPFSLNIFVGFLIMVDSYSKINHYYFIIGIADKHLYN